MTDKQIKIVLKVICLQLNPILQSVFLNKALKDDEQKVELTSTKTSFKRLTGPVIFSHSIQNFCLFWLPLLPPC